MCWAADGEDPRRDLQPRRRHQLLHVDLQQVFAGWTGFRLWTGFGAGWASRAGRASGPSPLSTAPATNSSTGGAPPTVEAGKTERLEKYELRHIIT